MVVAEVVKDSTENVSCLVTRGFTNRGFYTDILHGVNFDVTVNNDSIDYSSTNNNDLIQVVTKKRKVNTSTISAADKRDLNRKINALVQKNEKNHTAKDTADLSLKHANTKMRRLEADVRLLKKKFSREDADNFYQNHAIPRVGLPREVAALTAFLASDEATYSTGAEFITDGGWSAGLVNEALPQL